jgi:NAD(P)-dependent dehydrogenase (short-subunit alcohol dehydrogenase family)
MKKTVLVTGASSGIGREVVRQLCERGVRVFATGRDVGRLDSLRQETGCFVAPFDLARPEAPAELYAAAKAALGVAPDFLINNAGFNRRKAPVVDITAADLDEHMAVNFRAAVLLCGEAMRDMIPRKSGHIVNVASTVVWHQAENYSLYGASKCALHGFTVSLIKEARPHGIKVTGVYPGGTDTPFRALERPDYLRPESAARMIVDTLFVPADVVVHQLTFRPLVETNF